MIKPKEALELILSKAGKPKAVKKNLNDSLGLVLAKNLKAKINVPPFDNSAMDGFALHADDLNSSKPLAIISEVRAGSVAQKTVKKGCVVSIMTGAPTPKGTAAVVPVEKVELDETSSFITLKGIPSSFVARRPKADVAISQNVECGANIRRAGEDISKGSTVLNSGTTLKPIHIGLAASVGIAELPVYEKPKVAVVVTGDEIIKPGLKLKPGQIYESNSFLLKGLLEGIKADIVYSAKAKDILVYTVRTLSKALDKADVVLTTGGISVGKYDLIAPALAQIGAKCCFEKVAQKPGKPLSFFTYGKKLILSLPGNPVAVGITYELYVRPLLLQMSGANHIFRNELKVTLDQSLKKKRGRTNYIRVFLERKNQEYYAKTTGAQGSGVLSSMIADAIAILPAAKDNFRPGDKISAIDLEGDYQ